MRLFHHINGRSIIKDGMRDPGDAREDGRRICASCCRLCAHVHDFNILGNLDFVVDSCDRDGDG